MLAVLVPLVLVPLLAQPVMPPHRIIRPHFP
mgnify:CR=1 FL=1